MASFYASGPAGAAGGANPSVGLNGSPAPTSSTEIGFINSFGNEQGVSATNPLPVAFDGTITIGTVNVTELDGNPINLGPGTGGSGTQRIITDSASTIGVTSSVLPTGAATSANQSTEITALGTINTTLGSPMQQTGGSVSVTNFPSTAPPSVVFSGQQTSTGTAVAIASSQALQVGVIVQAKSLNAASVYVGPSGVTTSTGFELQPGQATSFAVNNLNAIYVIASTSGDGICYGGS